MKTLKFYFAIILLISTSACSNDDDSNNRSIEQQVENFVTPDLISALDDLGFIFRDGEETPNLVGDFLMSTSTLSATNILDDGFQTGTTFPDVSYNIISQNNNTRTLMIEVSDGNTTSMAEETFFSGNGNEFSVYIKNLVESNSVAFTSLDAISGIITEDGIENIQRALLILEKEGDEENNLVIGVGEGRLFIDADGLSERQ